MKKVLLITWETGSQYLMLSEVRVILDMCKDLGEVKVKTIEIPIAKYKTIFGK